MQKTITTVLSLMAMCLPVRGGQVAADSEMPMTSGYTINLGVGLGNVVNLTPRPESSWLYAVVDCVEGDDFVITGTGGAVPRLWGFLDEKNVLLSVADAWATANRLKLTAPARAAKLVINNCFDSPATAGQFVRPEKMDYINEVPDDTLSAMIRGVKFSDEIRTQITDFKKDGDKIVHVSAFCIISNVAYATYFANTRSAREWPPEQTARFAYCPLSDSDNKTYIDLCDVGDRIGGKKVTDINDTILFRKDDSTLYLAWTAALNHEHFRLYRTFDVATKTLSGVATNTFTVRGVTNLFNKSGIEDALRVCDIKHKPLDSGGGIGIMPKLSSREENGTIYYYTGLFYGQFNCIIKSADLINWEFVALPDFEIRSQWENAVYVIGDKVFYFVRQVWASQYGVLTCYNLKRNTWESPVYVSDAQSRSDFIEHNGVLYLIHAPKDRGHISVMRINQGLLNRSCEVQVAKVPDYFFPYADHYKGDLYMTYTASRKHIYLARFTIESITTDEVVDKFKKLFFDAK